MNNTLTVRSSEAGERIDKVLVLHFPNQSRSFIQGLLNDARVQVNGQTAKKNLRLQEGDLVSVDYRLRQEISLQPEPIPLTILFEDEHLLAINKPPGLVVHPGVGNWSGTFVNALLHHCKQLPEGTEAVRPGIVHRLDKDTSGVLLAAKSAEAQRLLMQAFAEQRVEKEYRAICVGNPGHGRLESQIGRCKRDRKRFCIVKSGGRQAITLCQTLHATNLLCEVALFPKTGRTHQLRVQLKERRTPILGDPLYGSPYWNKRFGIERQLLHASALRLQHPITGKPLALQADVPGDFHAIASSTRH